MNHRKSGWILGFGLLLAPAVAQATQPLDSFLERAKTQSFEARTAKATEHQRTSEADSALGHLLPAFSARGVYTRNQYEVAARLPGSPNTLVITPQDQLDAFLQLDVPLIDLASYHRYRATTALAESATLQRGSTTVEVSRSVTRAYYQFLGAAALVDSARESIKAAEANLKNVDDRRSAGAATDLDHERAAAAVARAEQDLGDAELGAALAGRSLETLSGLNPDPATSFVEDDLHGEGTLQNWMALVDGTPIVRMTEKAIESSEQSRKAANRAFLPTLTGSAQERITNATGFSGRNSAYTLQLILAWHLDYSTIANNDAQGAVLEAQYVRLEQVKRQGQDVAFEAFKRVEAGIAKCRAARAQASAATRAASLSADRYAAGVATQLDVTQAQREAFLATAAKIQADADLAAARASLRLAAGVPISDTRPR